MPRIVVLRFAEETRVDLVDTDDENEAIIDFAKRCLALGPTIRAGGRRLQGPSSLPLLEAFTIVVPADRIRELAGELPPPVVEPVKRPVLSIAGVLHNIRRFEQVIGSHPDVTEHDRRMATARLTDFFAHYEIEADFTEVWALPPLPKPEPHPSTLPTGDMKPPERPRMPTMTEIEAMDGVTPHAGKAP